MTVDGIQRRYLILLGLRWLPTGLLIPVVVLLMLDRGLTLGQIGLAAAAQGVMVLFLELPTGGLADTVGRRQVLLVASAFEMASIALASVADTFVLFAVVWAFQGVYRALESGPLESWYVDAAQGVDPDADIEHGIARGGVVVGVAIAAGTLMASALVTFDPIPRMNALVIPLIAALILRLVEVTAIWTQMVEIGHVVRRPLMASVRAVPDVMRRAFGALGASRVLKALIAIEAVWGFGMASFEMLTPLKLESVVSGVNDAAGILGPMNTVGWAMSAVGASLIPRLTRRLGGPVAGCTMLAAQSVFIVGIAFAAGPVGVVVAFVLTMTAHGAANPVHRSLVHRAVDDGEMRTTVLSANNLAGLAGGTIGAITLGALADAATLGTAIAVGAVAIAAAASIFLVVGRTQRSLDDEPVRSPVPSEA